MKNRQPKRKPTRLRRTHMLVRKAQLRQTERKTQRRYSW